MGLFDKLLGRGQARPDDKAIIQNSSSDLPLDASEIEKAISESASHLSDFKKYRWVKLLPLVVCLLSFHLHFEP